MTAKEYNETLSHFTAVATEKARSRGIGAESTWMFEKGKKEIFVTAYWDGQEATIEIREL